jgi:16S rRNA (guanine527-N7)-methyltransferase
MGAQINLPEKYFPAISKKQLELFSQLPELYADWNEKINLVSRKDIGQLMLHHVLHSLSIAKVISFTNGTKVIDVGTGGGFPGIPLAIFFPRVEFVLIDSIGKKINVVNEVASALGLKNVRAVKTRAEDFQERCDFVVSRAVATVSQLYNWTRHMVDQGGKNAMKNGWLLLKGGDLKNEIKESGKDVITFDLGDFFSEEFFEGKKILYFN